MQYDFFVSMIHLNIILCKIFKLRITKNLHETHESSTLMKLYPVAYLCLLRLSWYNILWPKSHPSCKLLQKGYTWRLGCCLYDTETGCDWILTKQHQKYAVRARGMCKLSSIHAHLNNAGVMQGTGACMYADHKFGSTIPATQHIHQ